MIEQQQPPPIPKIATASVPLWFVYALGEVGETELAGHATNPRIAEYLRSTSAPSTDDETPWCSAFCNWCVVKAGTPGTGSAAARSWLGWGQRTAAPTYGSIVVLWRDDPKSEHGHVAMFVRKDLAHVWLLGGNQGNTVSIASYPLSRVLDYRGGR